MKHKQIGDKLATVVCQGMIKHLCQQVLGFVAIDACILLGLKDNNT